MPTELLNSFAVLYWALHGVETSSFSTGRGQDQQEHRPKAVPRTYPHDSEAIFLPAAADAPPPFLNRSEAGHRLAQALKHYRDAPLLIMSLSEGGAVVAARISEEFHARFDLLLVRTIYSALKPKLAMGLVVDGPALNIFRNDHFLEVMGIAEGEFWDACQSAIAELSRKRDQYLGGQQPPDAKGTILVLVDEGAATGHMMSAALSVLRSRDPKKIVLAIPTVSKSLYDAVGDKADEIICLSFDNVHESTWHRAELQAATKDGVAGTLGLPRTLSGGTRP
jgi:putative phosphoribosyl transferase